MIAIVASLVVVLYVLVPAGLFRFVTSFSFPVKSQKTRTQEFTYAALFCLLPFLVALLLVWRVGQPFQTNKETRFERRLAYRTVYSSLVSDKQLDEAVKLGVFWRSVNSVLRRQYRFIFWYYIWIFLEAFSVSWLAVQYRSDLKRWRDRVGIKVLRPIISEWAVLLTDFGTAKTDAHIELDVLTTEGTLYQGQLKDHFFNSDGELAGVLLSSASRYDLPTYVAHREVDFKATVEGWPNPPKHLFTKERDKYWRIIPGANLFYIPRDRISNINVRHVNPDIPKATEERLAERRIVGYAITQQVAGVVTASGEVTANVVRSKAKTDPEN